MASSALSQGNIRWLDHIASGINAATVARFQHLGREKFYVRPDSPCTSYFVLPTSYFHRRFLCMYSRPSPFHTVTIGSHSSTNIRPAPSSPGPPTIADGRSPFADRLPRRSAKREDGTIDRRPSPIAH